jgi:hypothetical protein
MAKPVAAARKRRRGAEPSGACNTALTKGAIAWGVLAEPPPAA